MKVRTITAISLAALFIVVAAFAVFANRIARAEGSGISITLKFGEKCVIYEDKPLDAPDFTIIPELNDRKANGTHAQKLACIEENLARGASPKAAILYSFPLLEDRVNAFVSSINCSPEDATITFKPFESKKFTVTPEKMGYSVNEQRLYYDVYNALRNTNSPEISVAVDELMPALTAAELEKQTYLRARFSTDYSNSSDSRKHNVRLALSKMNGVVIPVGESFSFNKTVGARTVQRGFQNAKIIVDGEYTDGVGGGVCQASTTVYNAALLADMTILSAGAHSLVPAYVPAGFDAMVNSGSQDMVFCNNTDAPVYIRAYGTETTATVEIYGLQMEHRVVRESKIISRAAALDDKILPDYDCKYLAPDAPVGTTMRIANGSVGLTSESYLAYYDKNNRLITRKLIRKDTYRSSPGIIVVKPEQ